MPTEQIALYEIEDAWAVIYNHTSHYDPVNRRFLFRVYARIHYRSIVARKQMLRVLAGSGWERSSHMSDDVFRVYPLNILDIENDEREY